MKTINVPFEDKEFMSLFEKKEDKTWHDFIMELVPLIEIKEVVKELDSVLCGFLDCNQEFLDKESLEASIKVETLVSKIKEIAEGK